MCIGDRIHKKRLESELTLKELAEKIDVQDATVQRYESGTIKTIKPETIEKMARLFKVSPSWLMGWDESETPIKSAINDGISIIPAVIDILPEPKLLEESNILSLAPADVINGPEYFYYVAKDDSMINGGLEKSATILIHRQKSAADGQIVACVIDGVGCLKRFKQTGDTIILLSECSLSEPLILKISDFVDGRVTIIGVAVLCMITKKL